MLYFRLNVLSDSTRFSYKGPRKHTQTVLSNVEGGCTVEQCVMGYMAAGSNSASASFKMESKHKTGSFD